LLHSIFQVAPAELEGLLLAHPDVFDACVVGVKHEYKGEVPKAFVVKRAGAEIDAAAVHAHLRPKLAKFKWPDDVEFVDAIPKSASGKILRRVLRDK